MEQIDISKTLKNAFYSKGLKQKEVAEKIGENYKSLNAWVSGRAIPPGDKLLKMIVLLDIVEEFFPGYKKTELQGEDNQSLKNRVELLESKMEKYNNTLAKLMPLLAENPEYFKENFL